MDVALQLQDCMKLFDSISVLKVSQYIQNSDKQSFELFEVFLVLLVKRLLKRKKVFFS